MRPYCQYFNVFGERINRDMLLVALAAQEHFARSKTSPSKYYPDWRKSTVIYDNRLASVVGKVEQAIRARLPQVLAAIRVPAFDIGSFEIQLTSHNDGEYYRWHTDNGTRETEDRVITFVYYFYRQPKSFSGGELVIYPCAGDKIIVEPINDSMVFFPSRFRHEVRRVGCSSGLFEDGRFTLNGWIRKKVLRRSDDDYFDYKIFNPETRAVRCPTVYRSPASNRHSDDGVHSEHCRSSTESAKAEQISTQQAVGTLTSLLNLYGDLYRQSGRAGSIDVARQITRAEFYEKYYCMNRPVILKGLFEQSRAFKTWSPAFFRENYGSAPVQITTGRNSDNEYEANFHRTVNTVTMAAFVERLTLNPETNDFYLVARNYFFDNPTFRSLRRDLQPPCQIINVSDQRPGTIKLWFGPKDTVTPLHFDRHSILFAQVYGTKLFKLIPSFDFPRLHVRNNFYSAVDPQNVDADRFPDFLEATVIDITLEPGDSLFIPAGWWHWARSLSISISATFCSFHVENGNTSLKST